jgi:hypothetical protein
LKAKCSPSYVAKLMTLSGLEDYGFFGAIGAYHEDFSQVSDEEVIVKLKWFSGRREGQKNPPHEQILLI